MMDITLPVTLFAVFAAVALVAGSIVNTLLERSSPTRRRLEALVAPAGAHTLHGAAPLVTGTPAIGRLERLVTFVPASPKDLGKLRKRLTVAGFRQPSHLGRYLLIQLIVIALGVVLPLYFIGLRGGVFMALIGAIVGYVTPGLVLDRRIALRKRRIQNGLPDALDLLIVSIESGLALDQAILKTGEELSIAHPDLGEELRLINVECRAGKPRLEAFKNFAERTKIDEVRSLVAMLIQTDRFGTSVAQALRTHAEVSRTKRRQRAEERAAKIGVKLVFPLVFCLFPAFYVVTLGPAVIKFVHAFSNGGLLSGASLK
jgi:tight adherence protein C